MTSCDHRARLPIALAVSLLGLLAAAADASEPAGVTRYYERVEPILAEYCYGCHALGIVNAGVAFDEFESDAALLTSPDLWSRALEQVRAGLMPPKDEPGPSADEVAEIERWIKYDALAIDPEHPDPGRVTVRRLNRVEYRNTVRDLIGVDFDTTAEFPPDDTGHGFDTIGEVLTISPLLLEKYLDAAQEVVDRAMGADDGGDRRRRRDRRFEFPEPIPDDPDGQRAYARDLLETFATRAFRRPVGGPTADRLADLAVAFGSVEGRSIRDGIAQAMVAVLASPRFLFREEGIAEDSASSEPYPRVDEYALASRLSYFFWSTMPDDELFGLAERGELRAHLDEQVGRMLGDDRAESFVRNFIGQWLQARDVESVPINGYAVAARDRPYDPEADRRRDRFRELRRKPEEELTEDEKKELDEIRESFADFFRRGRNLDLTGEVRRAMRQETEMLFERIVDEDRSVLELLDSDYTFLNEDLAEFYGIEGVEGDRMQLVDLPADSPRGGVLTQGTLLVVTSNPDRTSPVKRGLFILENLLGVPPAPPPPDIPPLEGDAEGRDGRPPTLREALALHRDRPECRACHDRMDPLGLAFENFNAMGRYRVEERAGPIDAAGVLVTGEAFDGVEQLKQILATDHRRDFYRCLSEKLLTYAIGRGLDYHDTEAVDRLVDRLESTGGSAKALILGVVESAPFQRTRRPEVADLRADAADDPEQGADHADGT